MAYSNKIKIYKGPRTSLGKAIVKGAATSTTPLGKAVAKKLERRFVTRKLQDARRRVERQAAALRREADTYEKVRNPKTGRKRLSAQAKLLRKEASRLERYAKGSTATTKKGRKRTNKSLLKRIAKLDELRDEYASAAFKNKRWEAAAREAKKGIATPEFGAGDIGKRKVQAFYTWAQPYWRDVTNPAERNAEILNRLKVPTLQQAFEIFQSKEKVAGHDPFWVWVNEQLNWGFNTEDARFNELGMEKWENLNSDEKKALSNRYYANTR